MSNFVCKIISAFLAGIVMLLVCPYHACGQITWTTTGTAEVDVSNGEPDGLNPSGSTNPDKVVDSDILTFGNAGHTLLITDNDTQSTVNILGNITTVSGGGGTLIFDLQNAASNLIVGTIGNSATRRVRTVLVQNSGSGLTVENVYAGTLTIAENQTLTATGKVDAGTLVNNGTLSTAGGTVDILSGSGDITSTGDLEIGNTASGGYSGTIDVTGDLTVHQGVFGGDIKTTKDFTADLEGNLIISGTLTVGGDATFTGGGRAELGVVDVTGDFFIDDNTTVALDILNSALTSGIEAIGSGTLEVYGESDFDPGLSVAFTGGNFKNISMFTDWRWDGSDITWNGRYNQAHMSDGYLAAFTIHHRYTAWNMVHDRLIADEGRSVWINYTGRFNTYRSSFNNQNWKTATHGGQVGIDLLRLPRFQTGLLFGGEGSQSRNDKDQLNATDFYFGVYGAYLFRNGVDTRIVFAQGWQNYDLNRMGNGGVLYTSSFKGETSEANFELGKRFASGGWSLRPVIAADMYNNNLKAVKETGSGSEAVIYDKTSLTQVFIRTGMDLRHRTKDYTFNSGIYYAYDVNGAELRTIARSVGSPAILHAPLVGTKVGRSLLMFNLGVEGEIDKNFSAFGGYLGEYAVDSANGAFQSVGYVGFIGKW